MGYVCKLSEELQEQARKELGEDPCRRAEDIEHIRKWIKKQPHLKIRTDDWFILRFLRGSKFSLEKTKQKIDMHFTLKTMLPEWFKGRDPADPKLRKILELGILLPLREPDTKGRRVIMVRQGIYNPADYDIDDITKSIYMLIDVFYEEDEEHSIAGIVNLCDMKGLTMSHMLHYPATAIKKSMVLWQDGYALRLKSMHYINTSSVFDTMFNMVKGFMKDKIKNRISVHSENNLDSLYEEIPQRILPKEYGGTGDSVQEITDHWLKLIDARRSWILDEQKYRVDESKRPGKAKTTVDIFGLEGSFRKLNVD